MISKGDVIKAILEWPGLYEATDGRTFKGTPVSEIAKRLRDIGWRNVGREYTDWNWLRALGLEIVKARYIGGARPKQFCLVVVASPYYKQEKENVG